jgi:hypothetical protein
MSERRKIKNAERLANDVKAEAYQTRHIIDTTLKNIK